jgi:predicted phosphate transport protein (TIGR00153 family)
MKRKKGFNYFEAFVNLSKYSLSSAEILHKTMTEFKFSQLPNRVKEMHEIEHSADLAKHDIMNHLVKEFLPPIEREDIITLSQEIDDVTDSVEDVLLFINMFNIKSIRAEVLKFTKLISTCCKSVYELMIEFQNFKHSKSLHNKIVEINRLEEEGDGLYMEMMRNLYSSTKDPVELMTWTEILHRLEKCCDNCEDVADIIEQIVMKNS